MPTSRVKTNFFLTFEISAKWQNVCYTRQYYRQIFKSAKKTIKLYNEAEVDSTNSTRHHLNGFSPNSTGFDQIIPPI